LEALATNVLDYVQKFTSAESAQYIEILGQERKQTCKIPRVTS